MADQEHSPSTSRSATLDILRAIAIFLVLGRHLRPCASWVSHILSDLGLLWVAGGWTGVDLFFVLSGFLISGLLFKEHARNGSISFKRFFIRRGFKIYPAFYVMVAVSLCVLLISGTPVPLSKVLEELFFLQNYGTGGLWTHEWSLAVEEHFYIFLPILLIVIAGRNRNSTNPFRLIPSLFVAIALVCLSLRVYITAAQPFTSLTHLFPTHLRIDSLFFGVVISYYYHYNSAQFRRFARRFRPVLLVLGALAFVPAFTMRLDTEVFVPTVELTLLYLGGGLIVVAVAGWEPKLNKFTRAIAFVGSRSYSIYLWHQPFHEAVVIKYLAINWYTYAVSYLAGSIVIGIVMYRLVEYPALKIRDRVFPGMGTAAASPSLSAGTPLPTYGILNGSQLP
ncbi:MAG TPA: acyltransferase [Blastocatellia bacterium]|nr:acyltransferase [Blastocatellia bacterium]